MARAKFSSCGKRVQQKFRNYHTKVLDNFNKFKHDRRDSLALYAIIKKYALLTAVSPSLIGLLTKISYRASCEKIRSDNFKCPLSSLTTRTRRRCRGAFQIKSVFKLRIFLRRPVLFRSSSKFILCKYIAGRLNSSREVMRTAWRIIEYLYLISILIGRFQTRLDGTTNRLVAIVRQLF